jgi:hypothetical protein
VPQLKDVLADGSTYEISLKKLSGLEVVDVLGYISNEFGQPTFKLTNVVLSNGCRIGVEGEHDFPYLTPHYRDELVPAGLQEETLQALYDEDC